MIKVFNISSRIFCLMLMVHLLAASVCDDYLSRLINKSSIEQVIEIEEDTDKDSKNKNVEFEDSDDEYLVNDLNNLIHNNSIFLKGKLSIINFQYLQIVLPQCISEILIPPPR